MLRKISSHIYRKRILKELQTQVWRVSHCNSSERVEHFVSKSIFAGFGIFYFSFSEDLVKLFQHEGKVLRFKAKFAKPKPEVSWL